MSFRIRALPAEPFRALFDMDDTRLREHGAMRRVVDRKPGFPCRVSLADAEIGEVVVLVNYEHQPADSPYRSSHAIYVRQNAPEARPDVGEIPQALRTRLLSVRAFDSHGMLVDASVVAGIELENTILQMFHAEETEYLHLHNAKPGCYAARVDRA